MLDIRPIGEVRTDVVVAERVPHATLEFTCSELASDYAFFHHGSLFRHGGLDPRMQDPVADWYVRDPEPGLLAQHVFGAPIFGGFGQDAAGTDWDRTLCAVRQDRLDSLLMTLCGTLIRDPDAGVTKVYYAVRSIPDPVYVAKGFGAIAPRVEVAFALVDSPRVLVRMTDAARPQVRILRKKTCDAFTPLVLGTGLAGAASRDNPAVDVFVRDFEAVRRRVETAGYAESKLRPRDDARGRAIAERILAEQGRTL